MARKRSRSASPEATPAKAPRTSSPSPSTASPPSAPTPTLHLSSLIWQWESEPCIVSAEDADDPQLLGRYVAGPDSPVVATSTSWSSEHGAFVYKPTAPMKMRYTRKTFVGSAGSDVTYYGAIAGMYDGDKAQTIGPLLRLHGADEVAFPEVLPEPDLPDDTDGDDDDEIFRELREREEEDDFSDDDEFEGGGERTGQRRSKCGPGPPYEFYDTDWVGNGERTPRRIGAYALNLCEPDLPGQGEDDQAVRTEADDDQIESDGAEWNGWHGAWVSELLDRQARKAQQDTRIGIQWRDWGNIVGFRVIYEKMWGVEFEFKPISFQTYELYPDSKRGTTPPKPQINMWAYTVEAAVRRIFVTPKWFEAQKEEEQRKSTASTVEGGQPDV